MMPPLLRTLSLCLIAGLSLLLSACAHQPVRPVYTNSSLPEYWEAEGKAAIRSEKHGGNIYFTAKLAAIQSQQDAVLSQWNALEQVIAAKQPLGPSAGAFRLALASLGTTCQ